MSAAIVHCEIRVGDIERAKKFYSSVFEWDISPVGDGYWMVRAGRAQYAQGDPVGIDAVLVLRKDSLEPAAQPGQGYICNIEVEDLDQTLKKLEAAGGKIVRAKQPLEGVGHEAFCLDTEGNMISVMHDDSLVKLVPPTQS